MLSTTNQKMSFAVTFLPSLFLSGSAISSRLVRRFGTRTLGVTVGILVSNALKLALIGSNLVPL